MPRRRAIPVPIAIPVPANHRCTSCTVRASAHGLAETDRALFSGCLILRLLKDCAGANDVPMFCGPGSSQLYVGSMGSANTCCIDGENCLVLLFSGPVDKRAKGDVSS